MLEIYYGNELKIMINCIKKGAKLLKNTMEK
jgi:hypothetical protein